MNAAQRMPKPGGRRLKNWGFWVYVAPAILLFGVFKLWPIIHGLFLSFFKWNFITDMEFVGFSNYAAMFSKPVFWKGLTNTLLYIAGLFPFFIVLPLCLALMLLNVRARFAQNTYKTLYFIPTVLAFSIICYVWMWMFNPEFGLLNNFLRLFGHPGFSWLSDKRTAMPSVILVSGWKHLGSHMILFMAGLVNISREYVEAARIDGASAWQTFWRIKWPLLGPTMVYMVITSVIFSAERAFTAINILTGGGPANTTTNLSNVIYEFAFRFFNIGMASAISIFTSVFFFALTIVMMKTTGGYSYYEN